MRDGLCTKISKINGYIEEINKNKYLILVPTDERKQRYNTKVWRNIEQRQSFC